MKGRSSQVVLVNDQNFVVGDSSLLYAQDFTLNVSQVDSSTQGIITSSRAKGYDKGTGQLVSQPIVVDDTRWLYYNVAGTYDIILSVSGDTLATISILATVRLGAPPTLTGPAFTELAVDEIFNPLAGVTATDPEDGDITSRITVTGTVDIHTPGMYVLNYRVEDLDGNEATLSRVVLVNDSTFVVGDNYIIRAFDFTTPVSEVNISLAALMTAANTTVYDKLTGQLAPRPIEIVDLGGFKQAAGVYTITFKVTEGDNLAERAIKATVVAGHPPELTVPAFTEIKVGETFNPKNRVHATDIEEGDLINQIVIDNPVDVNKAGVYRATYTVTDADLNKVSASHTVVGKRGELRY